VSQVNGSTDEVWRNAIIRSNVEPTSKPAIALAKALRRIGLLPNYGTREDVDFMDMQKTYTKLFNIQISRHKKPTRRNKQNIQIKSQLPQEIFPQTLI